MTHILIVDDSPTDAYLVKNILEREGYKTSEASSGEEGIQKAIELRPNLIIMDVVMQGLNGFQATRKITKNPQTSSIPVVIVSSKNMESDRAWGLMQGAKEFLVKPIKQKELLETLKKLLCY
jgi:twitching motility two-component system response regulator PilH